ncbi:hypothetical protein ACFLV4_03155 [Chloroflexota bacterium]
MINETKQKKIGKKRNNTLTVVKVEYVQVPDADERLSRVFKILMSSFKDTQNEAKKA